MNRGTNIIYLLTSLLVLSGMTAGAVAADETWLTIAEATNYTETSTYDETIAYLRRMEKESDFLKLIKFGITPQNRIMYAVVASKDQAFTPEQAQQTGKPIILIENGIHAGEIAGKEASLALLRDILITKEYLGMLDNVILVIVPVFNVDGHERISPYNRANQNGPAEMGFRATAQRLNLNRDFLKADAPEMQALIRLFVNWQPHVFIDNHVTNGADYQYTVTYSITNNLDATPPIRRYVNEDFWPEVERWMSHLGEPIIPYVIFRGTPEAGLLSWIAPPRFSTGYAAIQNKVGLLVEIHMLKTFEERIKGNYALMLSVLQAINASPDPLVEAVAAAEQECIDGLTGGYPLDFERTDDTAWIEFLGYEYEEVESEIAGRSWVRYSPEKPKTYTIPWFNSFTVEDSVFVPNYYLLPPQWEKTIERLVINGVHIELLAEDTDLPVEMYRLTEPEWAEESYEGRHRVTFEQATIETTVIVPAGTIVVPLKQRGAKVAIHALEPQAPDAFVRWGLFNTIFERKTYIDTWKIEEMAKEMLAENPALQVEFKERLATDSTFRESPRARWMFFYTRSPYYERDHNLYPVMRVVAEQDLPTKRRGRLLQMDIE